MSGVNADRSGASGREQGGTLDRATRVLPVAAQLRMVDYAENAPLRTV